MINSVLKYRVYILLSAIFLIGLILRFYRISDIPVSLYWDEVSAAYNSFSILHSGKDEFGKTLPLLFRAFEDYKTPANIYLMTIPIALFGLNEFSARFTSAILGSFLVILTFFLVRELFGNKLKVYGRDLPVDYIGLVSAFLLAISPWSLQFSRTGFEANSGLFFAVLAITLFLRGINKKSNISYFISMASFSMSLYFYRSLWIFVPLMLAGLFFIFRKELVDRKNLKNTIIGIVIFIILILPFTTTMISKEGMTRTRQVNVISNSIDKTFENAKLQDSAGNTLLSRIVYNRRIAYAEIIIGNYTKHFRPGFLFLRGDGNGRHSVEGMGVMYIWETIFLLVGLFLLMHINKKTRNTLLIWLIIAPIPAALSIPSPHALRSLNMLPVLQILTAFGLVFIFYYLKGKLRIGYVIFLAVIIALYFSRYLFAYYDYTAIKKSADWADGYKQLATYVFENENDYEKVIISGHFWQPYVYFLFYKSYDPKLFQEKGSKSGFDKYIFGGTSWDMNGKELGDQDLEKLAGSRNILIALSPIEYKLQKDNIEVVKEVKNHNNELVFIIGKLK